MPKAKPKKEHQELQLIPGAVPKRGGTHPREFFYNQAAKYGLEALEKLVEIMRNGDNDNVRMAAARTILDKVAPDLKVVDVSGNILSRTEIIVRSYGQGDLMEQSLSDSK